MKSFGLATAIVITALGCASNVRPLPVSAGDGCFRCRRIIENTLVAGEIVTTGGLALKFRTVKCMAQFLAEQPGTKGTVFVTDFPTGHLVAAEGAHLVPAVIDAATNEQDYLAYADRRTAEVAAAEHRTGLSDWVEVRELARATAMD